MEISVYFIFAILYNYNYISNEFKCLIIFCLIAKKKKLTISYLLLFLINFFKVFQQILFNSLVGVIFYYFILKIKTFNLLNYKVITIFFEIKVFYYFKVIIYIYKLFVIVFYCFFFNLENNKHFRFC